MKKDKQIKYVDDLVESLKKNATIEFVDSSLNPENIQNAVKKQLEADEQAAAKQEALNAPKAPTNIRQAYPSPPTDNPLPPAHRNPPDS